MNVGIIFTWKIRKVLQCKFFALRVILTTGAAGEADWYKKNRETVPLTLPTSQLVFRKHVFYLAFENAICDDYVTEKFFNALGIPLTYVHI